ncbi:MarR family transcriptional regulator [Streptomyces sp. NBC_01356]|uniref:MarR family winged helix-turn-helix transcriptional regulator n=1 Tax=Streptomyces sp. NBC_01356 TaxID=2903836 RepID=UPI002E349C11|nr:MarR family transcriptional regulator [Streptomyces sp. NBC_01356]
MTETRWLTDTEHTMWRRFREMRNVLDRAIEQQFGESGLSGADYEVLVPLSQAPDRRLRARDLGNAMNWDRSRLSHQIRRMEQRGLLSRTDCTTDGRGTFIELTDAGWETLAAAAPSHVETVREVFFDLLTAHEVEVLAAVSEKVTSHIATIRGSGTND